MPTIHELAAGVACPVCAITITDADSLHVHLWHKDKATGALRGDMDGIYFDPADARPKLVALFAELAVEHPDITSVDKASDGRGGRTNRPPDPDPTTSEVKARRLGALRAKGWLAATLVEKDEWRVLCADLGEPQPPAV